MNLINKNPQYHYEGVVCRNCGRVYEINLMKCPICEMEYQTTEINKKLKNLKGVEQIYDDN